MTTLQEAFEKSHEAAENIKKDLYLDGFAINASGEISKHKHAAGGFNSIDEAGIHLIEMGFKRVSDKKYQHDENKEAATITKGAKGSFKIKIKKEKELDIFNMLKQSDMQNFDYFNTLSEGAQKEFEPWVFQRWLASRKLQFIDQFTNPVMKVVPKSIAWRLFCAIGLEKTVQYKFDAPPKKTKKESNLIVELIAKHYNVSKKVARTYTPLLTNDQIIEMAYYEDYDDSEIAEIKKVL